MALAVLTKGLLPVVLVAALIAYVALFDRAEARQRSSGRCRSWLRVALVAAWYAYAATDYPEEFAAQFFGDQISGNATKGAVAGCSPRSPATCFVGHLLLPRLAAPPALARRAVATRAFAERLAVADPPARVVVRRRRGGVRLQRRDRSALPAARATGPLGPDRARPRCRRRRGPAAGLAHLPLAPAAGRACSG